MLSEKCPFGHRYYDSALVLYYELLCYSFSRCSVTCNLQLNVTGCVVSSVLICILIHAYRLERTRVLVGGKYVCHVHMLND